MAGPQVQHAQRPTSAYYTGLNGAGNVGGNGAGGGNNNITTSASHTGLHALRQMSNDSELIYRGSGAHTYGETCGGGGNAGIGASTSRQSIIQQQPLAGNTGQNANSSSAGNIVSIAGSGTSASDALIVPSAGQQQHQQQQQQQHMQHQQQQQMQHGNLASSKANMRRSVEIIVDASQCGSKSDDDVEEQARSRKGSRHRHRPLHRRLISYVRSLFQGSTTQTDSELEEFETPARYRPDSLSALSRATRFTEDEIKRIYRGFKAECPSGVVKEDTFKLIYSQFFPQGGSCANPTLYAHYVFNTLDQDHSGIVSFEDFVQGLSILSRGSVEEKLRWTFSLYDINGDGFITRDEMTDIVTAIYELMGRMPDECPEEEKIKGKVERIFQKMDKNRDGVVTLDEFLEACRNDEAISRSMSVFDSAF